MEQSRCAPKGSIGGDIDDTCTIRRFAQKRCKGPDCQPCAPNVYRHDPVPGIYIDFFERLAADVGCNGPVVHQAVQMAIAIDKSFAHCGNAVDITQIDLNKGRIEAAIGQRGGRFASNILNQFSDDDRLGTCLGRRFRKGAAQPSASAGNGDDLVVQGAHQECSIP